MKTKKMFAICITILALFAFVGLAAAEEKVTVNGVQLIKNPDRPAVAEPQLCPDGSYIDIIPVGDKARVVVKGLKLFRNQVEVYGGGILAATNLDANGEGYIPARRRVNMTFEGTDGKWHYLLLDADDEFTGYPCLGKGVAIVPGSKGASLTAREWVRQ